MNEATPEGREMWDTVRRAAKNAPGPHLLSVDEAITTLSKVLDTARFALQEGDNLGRRNALAHIRDDVKAALASLRTKEGEDR